MTHFLDLLFGRKKFAIIILLIPELNKNISKVLLIEWSCLKKKLSMAYRNRLGKVGYVYILSNFKRTVFYIGVTSDSETRIRKHKNNQGSSFTKKYKLRYLMYFEEFPNIEEALEREKQLKNWHREWKINLIKNLNPDMEDLSVNL